MALLDDVERRLATPSAAPLVEDNDFNSWISDGTPVITTGQTDPFGTTQATLLEDDSATVAEAKQRVIAFTGSNGTRQVAVSLRAGSAAFTGFGIYDATVPAWRLLVRATWTGSVPTLTVGLGAGTVYSVLKLARDWYWCGAEVNGIIVANSNRFYLYPAYPDAVTDIGSVYAYGAQAWDSAQPPAATGWVLTKTFMPPDPDKVITLYETGGAPPEPQAAVNYPTFQVRLRAGSTGYSTGRETLAGIESVLHGYTGATINSWYYPGFWAMSDVLPLGFDPQDTRPILAQNYRAARSRTS